MGSWPPPPRLGVQSLARFPPTGPEEAAKSGERNGDPSRFVAERLVSSTRNAFARDVLVVHAFAVAIAKTAEIGESGKARSGWEGGLHVASWMDGLRLLDWPCIGARG